jgi:hypothetical protein
MANESSEDRKRWFECYVEKLARESVVTPPRPGELYRCPCCHCRTLDARGYYEICPVCYWEDDGQDDQGGDVVRGGPNGSLSLTKARQNYIRLGACEATFVKNVRAPTEEERR